MNNQNVAKSFAQRDRKGTGSNLFIYGDKIYSYGYHFVLAEHTYKKINDKPVVIVNSRDYSPTTQRHKRYVCDSLRSEGFVIVYIKGCEMGNRLEQIKDNNEQIKNYELKLSRAKVDHIRAFYNRCIFDLKEQNGFLTILPKI